MSIPLTLKAAAHLWRAAQELTRLEPTNAIAWNMRGLCAASQGKIKVRHIPG